MTSSAMAWRFIIIVNNIPPYGPELVNVLASPNLSTCRFRYQKKYAPTIGNISSLLHRDGTIVLRNHGTGKFMPLRTGRVTLVRLVGDIVYLTVELHNIAALASDSFCDEQMRIFNEQMLEAVGAFENPPGGDLLNLILFEDGRLHQRLRQWLEASDDDESAHWGNCILLMAEEFRLRTVDYFKIVELRHADNTQVTFRSTELTDGGFTLAADSTYTLVILQRTFTGKKGDSSISGNRFLDLTTNDDNVTVLRGRQPILGKYDVFNCYLRPRRTNKKNFVQLFVGVTGEKQVDIPRISPLELPLVVQPSLSLRLRTVLAAVGFAVLLVGYLFPQLVVSWLPAPWAVLPTAVEKLCIVGMILLGGWLGELPRELGTHFKLGV